VALRLKIFPEIETIGAAHRGVLVAAREKVWNDSNLVTIDFDPGWARRDMSR
jgi:hypothetical protein